MSMFSKKPTTEEKNEINALLARMRTCCKRLESVDSIDRFFTEWDKYLSEYDRLSYYESKGIKFTMSPREVHSQICAEIPRIERDVISRGYDRMQRDAAKLTTDKGKQKKADAFFNELEYYYSRLQPGTVEFIRNLRANTNFVSVLPSKKPVAVENKITPKFCSQCGSPIDAGAKFCGKCGNRL